MTVTETKTFRYELTDANGAPVDNRVGSLAVSGSVKIPSTVRIGKGRFKAIHLSGGKLTIWPRPNGTIAVGTAIEVT